MRKLNIIRSCGEPPREFVKRGALIRSVPDFLGKTLYFALINSAVVFTGTNQKGSDASTRPDATEAMWKLRRAARLGSVTFEIGGWGYLCFNEATLTKFTANNGQPVYMIELPSDLSSLRVKFGNLSGHFGCDPILPL